MPLARCSKRNMQGHFERNLTATSISLHMQTRMNAKGIDRQGEEEVPLLIGWYVQRSGRLTFAINYCDSKNEKERVVVGPKKYRRSGLNKCNDPNCHCILHFHYRALCQLTPPPLQPSSPHPHSRHRYLQHQVLCFFSQKYGHQTKHQ